MPFLPPNQQHQSTEGNIKITKTDQNSPPFLAAKLTLLSVSELKSDSFHLAAMHDKL